jgi:hypothetical protein
MQDRRVVAATNNATWCDLVCRAHGCDTTFERGMWTSRTRTPMLYPDAVTLAPEASARDLLQRIDTSPGCSIKDSFASLDLVEYGFRVLFDAAWIVHSWPAAAPHGVAHEWRRVRDTAALATWEKARHLVVGPTGGVPGGLLDHSSVVVAGRYVKSTVVAGVVVTCSPAVVGLSNFFTSPDDAATSWTGCVAFTRSLFPGVLVVGYESGRALTDALESGFKRIGPLRVWTAGD